MTIAKGGPAPYAPTPAILNVIEIFRNRSLPTPIDLDVLERIGVTASIAPRTLQALKLLGLLDDPGNPTDSMVGLRQAPHDELRDRLAAVVREAYADVFQFADPATDTPERVRDAFRVYRPPSVLDRMVRLFFGLCEAAGIIDDAPVVTNTPSETVRSRTRRPTAATPATPSLGATVPLQPAVGRSSTSLAALSSPPGLSTLHPALLGLLNAVPAADAPWPSRAKFESFKRAWNATLEIANPVPDGESGAE